MPVTPEEEPNEPKSSSSLATFGTRLLTDPNDVFKHNAWDNVTWDEEFLENARNKIMYHNQNPVKESDLPELSDDLAATHWDKFYSLHDDGFFKDSAVGNTVFPLLKRNQNKDLKIEALDFSSEAIRVLKSNAAYDADIVTASVWDMAAKAIPDHISPGSVDVIVSIFAFSALSPAQWGQAITNMKSLLKPSGLLLIRDYGRLDLTQIRFKAERMIAENFYRRGDSTRVYFFTNEELAHLFKDFEIKQNATDKRLLVNRKESKRMYRSWIQFRAVFHGTFT